MITKVFRYTAKSDADSKEHDGRAGSAHHVLSTQAGFVTRLLARNVDSPGDYLDAVTWTSLDQAKSSSSAAAKHEAVRTWLEHVNEPSVRACTMNTYGSVSRSPGALGDAAVAGWLLVRWSLLPGVELVEHLRNEIAIQHEIFGSLPGYRGAYTMHEVDGRTCLSLSAWASVNDAKAGVEQVLRQENELLKKHIADCGPEAAIEYFTPLLTT
jgi:heme-degrading monooxygenase HmoA